MLTTIVLSGIVIVNGIFAVVFGRDLIKHKDEVMKEPGNPIFLAIYTCVAQILGTFGISDFAMGAIVYDKTKIVDAKKLPGTLNAACTIPVAVMAFSYITGIEVDAVTLIACIVSQMIGAFVGPRFVTKLDGKTIRKFMGLGLVIAGLFIIAGRLNWIPQSGQETSLTGIKLIIACVALFIFGALNNIGIGSYAPTMATIYALGLSPAVAFPVMMGACTFSVPMGSMEFVRLGQYSRKVTLFSSIFGVIGVLVAVYVVKSLDVSKLLWVVAAVVIYTGASMLYSELKPKKA